MLEIHGPQRHNENAGSDHGHRKRLLITFSLISFLRLCLAFFHDDRSWLFRCASCELHALASYSEVPWLALSIPLLDRRSSTALLVSIKQISLKPVNKLTALALAAKERFLAVGF